MWLFYSTDEINLKLCKSNYKKKIKIVINRQK